MRWRKEGGGRFIIKDNMHRRNNSERNDRVTKWIGKRIDVIKGLYDYYGTNFIR